MAKPDLSEFISETAHAGPRCMFTRILPKLADEQRGALEAAFVAEDITAAAITRVLARWGHRMDAQTVNRHRKGECRCGR